MICEENLRPFCSGFKYCSEQWPKRWEHCEEVERDHFKKFEVANIYNF